MKITLYENAKLNPVGFPALMQKYRRGLAVQKRAGTEDFIYTGGKRKCADSPYGSANRA